ncbi:hypothetical protein, partial [Acinetobacter baumannii]|uniref:hypothetical protein n=1 Tax=Acinetobacter baumannii TaxID=470 RepID=UPI00189A7B0E
ASAGAARGATYGAYGINVGDGGILAAAGTDLSNYDVVFDPGILAVIPPTGAIENGGGLVATHPIDSAFPISEGPININLTLPDGGVAGPGGTAAGGGDLVKNAEETLSSIEASTGQLEEQVNACEHKF